MFCSKCGNELHAETKFCPRCGTKVAHEPSKPTVEPVREESQSITVSQTAPTASKKLWLIPIATTFVVCIAVGFTYGYEKKVDSDVEAYRQQGEKLALDGNLTEARKWIEKAIAKRPNHQALQADIQWIGQGDDVQHKIQNSKDLNTQQKFTESLSVLDTAINQAKAGEGPFFEMLTKQVDNQKTAVTVAQVKHEMQGKKTIEELSPLLTKLSAYKVPEAQEAATQIKNQIAEIAYTASNDLVEKKQFAEALQTVDKALEFDPTNNKLLSFKDTIKQQQTEFENAGQQRIEQAMVSAAKEDQRNRTQAVQVLQIQTGLNTFGDTIVTGQIKNVATRPIRMVRIYYNLYDANNSLIGSDSTYVYPNLLAPGDTGNFQDTYYGIAQGKRAEVTNITWYLN